MIRGRIKGAYKSKIKTVEQVWEKGCRKKLCWNSKYSKTRGKNLSNEAIKRPIVFIIIKYIQYSTNQGIKEFRRRFDGKEIAVYFIVYNIIKSNRLQR